MDKTPEASNLPENTPGSGDGDKEEEQGDHNKEENGGSGDGDTGNGDHDTGAAGGSIPREEKEPKQKENSSEEKPGGGSGNRRFDYEKRDQSRKEEAQSSPSPSAKPKEKIEKDTKAVTVSGNNAAGEGQYQVGKQTRKKGFFESAAVKVLTVTVSTLLLLGGIVFLLLYLLCSVSVFNDDGEGRMIYLGRCLIRKKEEEYFLIITQAMTEKSCTNRYCIKPGLFRLGKKEDQELIVYRDDKKAAVSLSKEMIVVL